MTKINNFTSKALSALKRMRTTLELGSKRKLPSFSLQTINKEAVLALIRETLGAYTHNPASDFQGGHSIFCQIFMFINSWSFILSKFIFQVLKIEFLLIHRTIISNYFFFFIYSSFISPSSCSLFSPFLSTYYFTSKFFFAVCFCLHLYDSV
jgi:hypothetical protein